MSPQTEIYVLYTSAIVRTERNMEEREVIGYCIAEKDRMTLITNRCRYLWSEIKNGDIKWSVRTQTTVIKKIV
ncbi:MAG: hypothetical protein ABJH64_00105 [Algoriphagus sp.]|uniref:hypothetical protein n=1 Tax=Algoriphagus sp. TaxID=1872435 RepID=UPI00326D023C